MKKIGVMIIEDSPTVREALRDMIENDGRLEIVSCVANAEEALRVIHRVAPDVISLDIRLPGMDGLEATLKIMAERPTPIVVIAENVEAEELKISMNALRAGALTVLEKPHGLFRGDFRACARGICDQLVIMSGVKVVRQRIARELSFGSRSAEARAAMSREKGGFKGIWDPKSFVMLGVVASTGGPNALIRLFQSLPPDFPLPIVLVQHITASFLQSFATWLGGNCPFQTVIASEGEVPRPGKIYMAPVDHHLVVSRGRLKLGIADPVCSQRPSGTVLFKTMAESLGEGALGVLLTGMGSDGADGLLEVRKAGGYTIAEDATTAVVYGMPEVAERIGATCESLPIGSIGPRILELISIKAEKSEKGEVR